LEYSEHIIFPEIDIDKINKIMGLEITFVTDAKLMKKVLPFLKNLDYHLKNKLN
jgi:large subunit ribosomal protein L5